MNILILCKANYCRSPVCEKILKSKLGDSFVVSSAGIIDFIRPSMHISSLNFLKSNAYEDLFHNPKIVTYEALNNADIIFCLDHEVAEHIRKNFYKFFTKIKMYNFLNSSISTVDPISFNDNDYIQIMENLEKCSNQISSWLFEKVKT